MGPVHVHIPKDEMSRQTQTQKSPCSVSQQTFEKLAQASTIVYQSHNYIRQVLFQNTSEKILESNVEMLSDLQTIEERSKIDVSTCVKNHQNHTEV